MKPTLVDLFCSAGGASKGYQLAGFDVVGVDIKPQPNYPFKFHQADALTFDVSKFDAVHASPPCQGYSSQRWGNKHPRLIADVREKLEDNGKPFIIENIEGARFDLRAPVLLCGSSFGLRVRRHRLFESSVKMKAPKCNHAWQDEDRCFDLYDHGRWFKSGFVHVYGKGGGKGAEHWPLAMGIDWMTRAELAEAIPPAYTLLLGMQLIGAVE